MKWRLPLGTLAAFALACSSNADRTPGSGGATASSSSGGASSGGGGMSSTGGFGGASSTTTTTSTTSSSSTGGSGGGVALPCPTHAPSLPACDPSSCNNGVIDACLASYEQCDGSDLNGASCASLGFSGGALGCQSHCAFDTSGCQRCEPAGGALLSCGAVPVSALRPRSVDISSDGTELGMAWVSLAPDFSTELRFARFTSALAPINELGPLQVSCPERVALGATDSGWLLAIESQGSIELLAIDDSGTPLGSSLLAPVGYKPAITKGPAGNTLVTWFNQGAAFGAVVSDQASALTLSTMLPFGTLTSYGEQLSTAYVGDGYLLAARSGPGVSSNHMSELGVLSRISLAYAFPTGAPLLAAEGSDVRLTFFDLDSGVAGPRLRFLQPDGWPLGDPIELGFSPQYISPTHHTLINGTSLMLLAGPGPDGSIGSLDVYSLDAQGMPLATPARVITDPTGLRDIHAERVGATMVAAWISGSPPALGFAQLQP